MTMYKKPADGAHFAAFAHDPKDPSNRTTFEIHDVDLAIINGIRRAVLADVPVLGFQGEGDTSVRVLINTGRLHNEFLVHRIGLVPLHMTEEEIEAFPGDEWRFELHVRHDGATPGLRNVSAADFRGTRNGQPLADAELRRIFPAHPLTADHVLITRLHAGEEIHLEADVVKRSGRTHAGFAPVSICTYQFLVDPKLAEKATGILDRERAFARNAYGEPLGALFSIEPEGGLPPRYLIDKALEILAAKVEHTLTEIHAAESQSVVIRPVRGAVETRAVEFVFQDEDDTLGNLLQSALHDHYVRRRSHTAKGHEVCYVGYFCPHPLQSVMVLRIDLADREKTTDAHAVEALAEGARGLLSHLQDLQREWRTFAPRPDAKIHS